MDWLDTIDAQLAQWAEPDYQRFASSLLPGVTDVIGVRLPKLRTLAKRIAQRPDAAVFLAHARSDTFEQRMLHGMVIGALPAPLEQQLPHIAAFLPRIDNWSVCDSFCCSLKATRQDSARMWAFLRPLFTDPAPYIRRFAVVMLLDYYIDAAHLESVLALLDGVPASEEPVSMAVAWAISMCFVFDPRRTMVYLQTCRLDALTYRRALQKIVDSRRVTTADKQAVRTLRARLKGE